MTEMKVELIAPQGVIFSSEKSVMAILPGTEGELGILAKHCDFVSTLEIGWIKVKESSGKEQRFFIAGGFVEVSDNQVSILADVAESAESIDIERAKQAKKRAEERLLHKNGDLDRAEFALKKALFRIQATQYR